jgi:hypothetical protein
LAAKAGFERDTKSPDPVHFIPLDIVSKGEQWMKTSAFREDRIQAVREVFDEAVTRGSVAVFAGKLLGFVLQLYVQLT